VDLQDLDLLKFFGGSYTPEDIKLLASNYRFNKETGDVVRLKSNKKTPVFTFTPFSAKYFYLKAATLQYDSNYNVVSRAIDMYLEHHKANNEEVQAGLSQFNFFNPSDLQRFCLRRTETFRFQKAGKDFVVNIVDSNWTFEKYESTLPQVFDPYSASHDIEPVLENEPEPDWSWTNET